MEKGDQPPACEEFTEDGQLTSSVNRRRNNTEKKR